jgi:hypothetical protein
MRKIFLLLVAVLGICFGASAQPGVKYKPFSVSFNLGYVPVKSGIGIATSFEPAYALGNNKLGFRMEGIMTDMRAIGSYVFSYDRYLLNEGNLRLSAGGGMGYFNADGKGGCSPGPTSVGNTVHTMNHFGGMLRTTMNIGHFKLGVDYNFVPPTIASDIDAEGKTTGSVSHANNYLNFHFGVTIGGGRKKNN